jgi:hypothetical protein
MKLRTFGLWALLFTVAIVAVGALTGQPHPAASPPLAFDPNDLWHFMVIGAVTPSTLTELTDLAKDYFTNVYVQLVNPETPLKAQFAKLENAQFTGKKWIFGVKTQIGGASANAGANKSLPAANQGQYDQGEATVVRTYTRMALDGLAIEVTKKQTGSFRPALAEVMSDRLQQHDLEVNRQMFGPATGALFGITTGAASATQTPGTGVAGAIGDYNLVNGGTGLRHIYVGDVLEFYDSTLVTKRAGGPFTVTAVGATTVTLSGSVTTSNADVGVRATADTDNIVATEANGLLKSVAASGTFEAIPATFQGWKSIDLNNAGTLRDISDSLVMQMIETIRSRSRLVPNLIVTRPGIVLKYSEIFLPLRRLDGQDVQLKGGYKPLAAVIHAGGSIPVVGDNDAPNCRMFFLNTGAFRLADLVGTEWADMDGATFDRVVDKDSIEGYVRKYWNLITVQRNANGLLSDLNDIAAVDKVA